MSPLTSVTVPLIWPFAVEIERSLDWADTGASTRAGLVPGDAVSVPAGDCARATEDTPAINAQKSKRSRGRREARCIHSPIGVCMHLPSIHVLVIRWQVHRSVHPPGRTLPRSTRSRHDLSVRLIPPLFEYSLR